MGILFYVISNLIWEDYLGNSFPTLTTLILTPVTAIAFYLLWLGLLIVRFGRPLRNSEFLEIVEEAKSLAGRTGRLRAWESRSDRPLLMTSWTPLYAAVLVSKTTVKDIIDNKEDGKNVLSFWISGLSRRGFVLFMTCLGGMAIVDSLYILYHLSPSLIVFELYAGIVLIMAAIVLVLSVYSFTAARGRFKRVPQLYGKPIALSMLQVFGPRKAPEGGLSQPSMLGATIAGEGDVFALNQFAAEVDTMLAKNGRTTGYQVSRITGGYDDGGLAVLKPRRYYDSETICRVPQDVVRLMPRADMLGPYVVYEVAYSQVRAREKRYTNYLAAPFLPLFPAVLFIRLFTEGLSTRLIEDMFVFFFFFCLYGAIIATSLHFWWRRSLFKLEENLARQYPGYAESIKALVEAGYATGIGAVSLRDRLKRLQRVEVSEGTSY
jgi:hypothetical protein